MDTLNMLLKVLGWQGGTIHNSLDQVRKLIKFRNAINLLVKEYDSGQIGSYDVIEGIRKNNEFYSE